MKKVLLIAAVAGLSFTSCKKDYTCECTASGGGLTQTSTVTIKDTKKKADDACTALSTSSSASGVTISTSCKIK